MHKEDICKIGHYGLPHEHTHYSVEINENIIIKYKLHAVYLVT